MAALAGFVIAWSLFAPPAAPSIRIQGEPVSAEAWKFLWLTRGLTDEASPEIRRQVEEQLIERELIRRFLAERKVDPPADLLDLRVFELEELIRRRGTEPAALYARLGLSAEGVRRELALSVAWETYIERTVTPQQLREFFETRRAEFDGTRVRLRQIFRKATKPAEVAAAESLLARTRDEIAAGRLTFEAAAKAHSQSPTRERGGDVGWIVGTGQLPENVASAALRLSPGKMAGPLPSPMGMHLVEVTERQEGQLSLEDARPQLLEQLARTRWSETIRQLSPATKIERER